jgi:hypothetical protein
LDATAGLLGSIAGFAAVWVLPGFALGALADRLGTRTAPRPAVELARALVLSLAFLAVVGGTLLALRWFGGAQLAVPVLLTAVAGLPAALRWAQDAVQPWWRTLALLALALPWLASAATTKATPSHSYQWYYWELGRQLSEAGGVPSFVLEFGEQVRWHPDYVFFSVGSEAYRWLTGPLGETAAIVGWRAPVALTALALAYATLRLWLTRAPAIIGCAALAASTYLLVKFDAYKPESLGAVPALAALVLAVSGVRARSAGALLLAGAGAGLAMGVHGIAAAVIGAIGGIAALVEWRMRRSEPALAFRALLAAAALTITVIIATGLALQGRAVVASDAANPALGRGEDPTWAFLRRHEGEFGDRFPPAATTRAVASIRRPWPAALVRDGGWALLLAAIAAALVAALRSGRPRTRRAAAILLAALALLALAGLAFALAFDTFIPQHTGMTRMGAYSYLVLALAVGVAAQLGWSWARRRFGAVPSGLAAGVLAFALTWSVATANTTLAGSRELGPAGEQVLERLRAEEAPGTVLSNASTRGLIEFAARREAPIEGRQPVIEDPGFLRAANARLEQVERFFNNAGLDGPRADRAVLDQLDVGWIIAADPPEALGTPFSFSVPAGLAERLAREPGLSEAFAASGLTVFRVAGAGPVARVGSAQELAARWGLALGATLLITTTLAQLARARDGRTNERSTDEDHDAGRGRRSGAYSHRVAGLWRWRG